MFLDVIKVGRGKWATFPGARRHEVNLRKHHAHFQADAEAIALQTLRDGLALPHLAKRLDSERLRE